MPRAALAAVVVSWIIRVGFLGISNPLSDEPFALRAASGPVVAGFFGSASPAEAWTVVRALTTGDRPLWGLSYLMWGRIFPGDAGAYALSLAAALVAALALAGCARRLYGRDVAFLVLLAGSLSPLSFHYSVCVLAPSLCEMWVSLALFFLTSSRWRVSEWAAGGFCLGLAFGTHMAAGAPALGLAAALGISSAAAARDDGLLRGEKLRRALVCPLAGGAAALAPLLAVAAWAGLAGDSYAGRLIHHENFGFANTGPVGLWLRELFELSPMLEVVAGILICRAVFGQSRSRRRFAIGAGLAVLALLASSLRQAPARAGVSIALFAFLAAAAWRLTAPWRAGGEGDPPEEAASNAKKETGPLGPRSLVAASVVAASILTIWPSVGAMPRLVFPSWPLFVLALFGSGGLLAAAPARRWIAPLAMLGCLLAGLEAYATLRARTIPARARVAARRLQGWRQLNYEDLWPYDDRIRSAGWLATRSAYEVAVVSTDFDLDPVWTYEEEPYKIGFFQEMVGEFGLRDILRAETIPWARIFFRPGPTAGLPSFAGPVPP